jgi:hypothetical protein
MAQICSISRFHFDAGRTHVALLLHLDVDPAPIVALLQQYLVPRLAGNARRSRLLTPAQQLG